MLRAYPGSSLSIQDLTRMTSILADDIVATLQLLGILAFSEEHQNYILNANPALLDSVLEKYPQQGLLVDPTLLNWAPLYVVDWKKDKWSIKAIKDEQ